MNGKLSKSESVLVDYFRSQAHRFIRVDMDRYLTPDLRGSGRLLATNKLEFELRDIPAIKTAETIVKALESLTQRGFIIGTSSKIYAYNPLRVVGYYFSASLTAGGWAALGICKQSAAVCAIERDMSALREREDKSEYKYRAAYAPSQFHVDMLAELYATSRSADHRERLETMGAYALTLWHEWDNWHSIHLNREDDYQALEYLRALLDVRGVNAFA